jgi:hypothetical protein
LPVGDILLFPDSSSIGSISGWYVNSWYDGKVNAGASVITL